MDITDYLVKTADQCAVIARTGRMLVARLETTVDTKERMLFSQLSDGGRSLSAQVDQIAQSLLAKAVEIDNDRQRKGQSDAF